MKEPVGEISCKFNPVIPALIFYTIEMKQRLAQIALVVRDYDEAIQFYTEILKFDLIEDTQLTPSKRWVIVQPPALRVAGFFWQRP